MARQEPGVDFAEEPLVFLDQAQGDALWLPGRQLCLAEPDASRAVLANKDGLYDDHADFFRTQRGTFGPREAQVRIGREARVLVQTHIAARADALAGLVQRMLGPVSEWPDAGNWLLYRHLSSTLLGPDSPDRLRRIAEEIVERAVLAGAKHRRSFLSRAVFRFRVARALGREIERRRKRGAHPAKDLLDVVITEAGADAHEDELAEVFLSFVFAVAGSIGFVLGWSLYLLGTNPRTDAEPGWVVREALRLWPVAWLLGCRPAKDHEVAGVAVTPKDEVVVCPYLVHRHPKHWDEPTRFRPERWATLQNPHAFIPFGWGPHRCPAASLSVSLVEDILRIITEQYEVSVTAHETRPNVGAALAPPRFTLQLSPRLQTDPRKGGD